MPLLYAWRGPFDRSKNVMPQCLDLPRFVELLKKFTLRGSSDIIKDCGTMPLFNKTEDDIEYER